MSDNWAGGCPRCGGHNNMHYWPCEGQKHIYVNYREMEDKIGALEKENEEKQKALDDCFDRLEKGTLHLVYCSAGQNTQVGGPGCCCPMGKETKKLRHEIKKYQQEIDWLKSKISERGEF